MKASLSIITAGAEKRIAVICYKYFCKQEFVDTFLLGVSFVLFNTNSDTSSILLVTKRPFVNLQNVRTSDIKSSTPFHFLGDYVTYHLLKPCSTWLDSILSCKLSCPHVQESWSISIVDFVTCVLMLDFDWNLCDNLIHSGHISLALADNPIFHLLLFFLLFFLLFPDHPCDWSWNMKHGC